MAHVDAVDTFVQQRLELDDAIERVSGRAADLIADCIATTGEGVRIDTSMSPRSPTTKRPVCRVDK